MKNFEHWGTKVRDFPEYNYHAIWNNLQTIRTGEGIAKELPPDRSEFYDIGIGTKCVTGNCPFCYVSASKSGRYFKDICKSWKKFMSRFGFTVRNSSVITDSPFQVAIGSTCEPTEHPEFCKLLETIYHTHVVPNYTTNGVILSYYQDEQSEWYGAANDIMRATRDYVGGVAVSFGNPFLRPKAEKAVEFLLRYGNTNVNIHHIISTKESVDDFISQAIKYGDEIAYHVLLPLTKSGRCSRGIEGGVFEYMIERLEETKLSNIAFGAHFKDSLETQEKIKTWIYPEESLSKNLLLMEDEIVITRSSFNLEPIMKL